MHFVRTPLASACLLAITGLLATAHADESGSVQLDKTTVVSTASGFEQNIADAPASISVISAEELNKKSYTSVVDAIKNIPGVYMTGGGAMTDISIRGMAPAYTLMLVDGRPVSAGRNVNTNGTDGGKQIGLPPLSMIDRIEVIRGPMSSLYGSEAMGGVINIITKKTTREWSGNLNTEWTHSRNDLNNDSRKVDLALGGGIIEGLLGMQLSGSWLSTDESDHATADNKASASTPDGENTEGTVKFVLTPNDANEFGLGYTKAKREYTHNPGKSLDVLNSNGGLNTALKTRYEKDIWLLSHDGRYGNILTNTWLQHDISENKSNPDAEKREDLTTLNSQASVFLGRHTLTFGGQYKKEKLVDETNGMFTANIPGAVRKVDRWLAALYAEMDWGVTENFSVTTGLRYNDDELFGSHWSPRIYGVYHLTDDFTLKGGVSTGYKQPGLGQATRGFGTGTGGRNSTNYTGKAGSKDPNSGRIAAGLIVGNPDLDPETSTSYEFGYVYDNSELGLNTSAMLFYTQFKDKIAEDRYCTSPGASGGTDYTNFACEFGGTDYWFLSTGMNISKADMHGVELSLDYRLLDNLKLSSSYTYTDSEQKSGDFKGKPLNKMPKHMANLGLDWQAMDRLGFWTQYNYRSKTSDYLSRTSMSDGTPGYGFVDAGLNYALTDSAMVKFGLYNIANKEVSNSDYEAVLDGRRINLGLSVNF